MSVPGDHHERQADRIAQHVMGAPAFLFTPIKTRAELPAASSIDGMGTGRALDQSARDFFEPRFGVSLSAVRIHDGESAELRTRARGARAYAYGRHIVLGDDPPLHSSVGRGVLAHELAHVVQQSMAAVPRIMLQEDIVMKNPSDLTDAALVQEINLVRTWLMDNTSLRTDYGAMEEYLQALEAVYASRSTSSQPEAIPEETSIAAAPILGATHRYLTPRPRTPLDLPQEGIDMPWVGRGAGISSSELGYLRDHEFFWSQYIERYPGRLSPENVARVIDRRAPIVDDAWLEFHPQHAAYRYEILEHHHVGQGTRAVPLPEGLHDAYTVFHPQRRVVGTPAGGTRPIPTLRTAADAQTELNRHIAAGRIRGEGIDPDAPPAAPEIPPASELAVHPDELPPPKYVRLKGLAKFGGDIILSYITTEVALGVLNEPDLSEADRAALSDALGAVPAGVNILIAADVKFMMEVVWKPLIEGYYQGGYEQFKEVNPDATPTDYLDAQQAYDEFQSGNW
jgi:hypothetical protein